MDSHQKYVVVGGWLNDRDITAWLTNKLYQLKVDEPRAWTMVVSFILSLLLFRDGLGWCRRHTIIVNSDDREGLHWFLCAMDCTPPIWAFIVWIWEPLGGTSLIQPMVRRLRARQVIVHAKALGFQKDGWTCGYQWLHLSE